MRAHLENEQASTRRGGANTVKATPQRPCANILGVAVDAVDMERTLDVILSHLKCGRNGYVCAVGVHGILESLKWPELAQAYSESIANLPDGTPTVWLGWSQGFKKMNHVTGPALMLELFRRRDFASCSHYFYGGKPRVAQELASTIQRRFPRALIAGSYTPPFRDLTEIEERELVTEINLLQPDILWVGISTPRQELWMRRMLPRLNTRLMLGVGAAFDFHTGRIRECPPWVKRFGFNWLHRLVQDPRRLWRRNVGNTAFLWHIALQMAGVRNYPMHSLNTDRRACDHRVGQTYSDAEAAASGHLSHRL